MDTFYGDGLDGKKSRKYDKSGLVVNLYVDGDVFRGAHYFSESSFSFPIPEYILESRFHVWRFQGQEENGKGNIGIVPIETWLEWNGIEVSNKIRNKISRYEKLVEKWLSVK